jgi:hypothetical protein
MSASTNDEQHTVHPVLAFAHIGNLHLTDAKHQDQSASGLPC